MIAEAPVQLKQYTLEEYFALEEGAEQKHEYRNGKIITMPGGSIPHNKIGANVHRILDNWVEANNLKLIVLNSDTKIRIEDYNQNVYPDVLVVCEKVSYWKNRRDIIVNPLLIFEVLSDCTEEYDREDNFSKYRTLPSFKEYVLIDQYKPSVHAYFQQNEQEDLWKIKTVTSMQASIPLRSIGFELPMAEVYWMIPELQGELWQEA